MTKKREEEEQVLRVRLPNEKEGEVLGVVISLLGGARMLVLCKDGKERNCRVPGKLKNKMWIREGNVVIVKPWEIEGDKRGDIIWRYRPVEVEWLKKHGYIDEDFAIV